MSGIPTPSRRQVLSIPALALAGLLLTGCATADPVYLPALTVDPMATYSHPELDLEYRLKDPKHNSWLGGHEVGADVSSSWIPTDDARIDEIVEDILEKSQEAGWVFLTLDPEPVESGDTYWRAHKYLDEGLAGLVFRVDPSSWRGGVDLWMNIDFIEEDIATPLLAVERDAEYEDLVDLRDAVEASGIRCDFYSSESPNGVPTKAATSTRCNEYLTLHTFDSHVETQAYMQESIDLAAERGLSFLVGPNWILSLRQDVEFGPYLQGELGGELVGNGSGS